MIIRSIELRNFRNFERKEFDFCDSVNVISGFNGQGKTNLLEAIFVSCLSKSFRTKNDGDLLLHQKENFSIKTRLLLDNQVEKTIDIFYQRTFGKRIEIDNSKIKGIVDFFGTFPAVILSPEDDVITTGPPAERRKFLNFFISQVDRNYLKLLQDYERTIKQRNKILQDARESRYKFTEKIEPWNENLYHLSRAITSKRRDFLLHLDKIVRPIYQELTLGQEEFSFAYHPSFQEKWTHYENFKKDLEDMIKEEIVRGITLTGPHRDEILFTLNGHDLRKYGSRGQHRSFLLSLKIAMYKIILEKKKETPVFLLDDVYGEIDQVRERALNEYFMELKQVFVTTHEKEILFHFSDNSDKKIKYILIENNKITNNSENL